jgi:hypothetical protein
MEMGMGFVVTWPAPARVELERGDRVGRTQEGPAGRRAIHPSVVVGRSLGQFITSTPGWIRITLSSPTVVAIRMHVHYSTSIHHPGFFISSAFSNVVSLSPPRVTYSALRNTGAFTLSVPKQNTILFFQVSNNSSITKIIYKTLTLVVQDINVNII